MSSFMRVEMAPGVDEDMAEALNAGGTLVAQFTPASNRAPAGTAALEVPCEPCEDIWAALEELHWTAFR